MCDQTEISYTDEEVVWVKLGNCWWPGEVVAPEKLGPDVVRSFRKPPIAIVKFFQEDAYEFVKNINCIYKYECSRKNEFINKGLCLFRSKHGPMEKFPEDIIRAETKVGGDVEILTRDEFQETKKESYAGLFGTPPKKPSGFVKKGRGRPPSESHKISTPVRRMKEKTDYKVHILVQGSKSAVPAASPSSSTEPPIPSTSTAEATTTEQTIPTEPKSDDIPDNVDTPITTILTSSTPITPSTPSTQSSGSGVYACHACSFTTTRLNVLILHNKSHSVGFVAYTPTPVKKTPVIKSPPKLTPSKTPKQRKPRKEKTDKPLKNKKRLFEEKTSEVQIKKLKTDEEIKSSLLADWDDDVDDESHDESATAAAQSPEVPLGAESPAVPTSAELPSVEVTADISPVPIKKTNSSLSTEKPEASSDSNKYEFCEDEDWPVEADVGRKIPRVKNPIRTEETKSISIDEDDMAREVAELLNRTAVPELPSVPESLKVEENFPEPSVVKSPDKKVDNSPGKAPDGGIPEAAPTKAIFKTKTFFRSRHSRSQDAIGKYVAEQLNNVEKMDIADCDLNGSDNVSSPEARDSPPIEHVKVARLAPKIQLKKMKAEAQLREKERNRYEPSSDPYSLLSDIMVPEEKPESPLIEEVKEKESKETLSMTMSSQNVLYPTQEIKPVTEMDAKSDEITEETVITNNDGYAEPVKNYDKSMEAEDGCVKNCEVSPEGDDDEPGHNYEVSTEVDDDEPDKNFEVSANGDDKTAQNYDVSTVDNDDEPARNYEVPTVSDDGEPAQSYEVSTVAQDDEPAQNSEISAVGVNDEQAQNCEVSEVDDDVAAQNYQVSAEDDDDESAQNYEGSTEADDEPVTDAVTTEVDDDVVIHCDASKESNNTRETITEENHQMTEESESSQETYAMEAEHKENVIKKSNQVKIIEEVVQDSEILYQDNIEKSIEVPSIQLPDQLLSYTPEPPEPIEPIVAPAVVEDKPKVEPYMNESTASAVDALLSVSREADRVTRTISDDPPEDLFEDDKDGSINTNGETNDIIETEDEQTMYSENEQVTMTEKINKEADQNISFENVEYTEGHESRDNECPANEAQITTQNKDNYMIPKIEKEIMARNDETDQSVFATNIEEIPALQLVSNKNVFENKENSAIIKISESGLISEKIHEESNNSDFIENVVAPVVHEDTANNVFPENQLHIPETHEVSQHVMMQSGFSENEEEIITTHGPEIVSEESVYLENEEEIPVVQDETEIPIDNNPDQYITSSEIYQNEEVVTTPHSIEFFHGNVGETIAENVPSASDLQIAEALINLPATALHSKTPTEHLENHIANSYEMDNIQEEVIPASENIPIEETVSQQKTPESTNKLEETFVPNDDSVNLRFETEQEKSENLNAAQSLLHMSASIEHTISVPEPMETIEMPEPVILNLKQNNGIDKTIEQNMASISTENMQEPEKAKKPFHTTSSKLLQMLEEPSRPKFATKITPTKQILMRGKEKILNFDVAKSSFKSKSHSPKQKIIIRRTTPSKTVLNKINEIPSQEKIILSRSNPSQDGSSVQRFTIQTSPDAPSDANTIIIQQKIRKLSKPALQKIKPHTSLVAPTSEPKAVTEASLVDNAMFDINSMPIVLSEDFITAESIEKMPVVMSDANINPIISQPHHPPKVMKSKINISSTESEKITVTSTPKKPEVKTLLMNPVSEVQNKSTTPNILSKSAKLRAAKPMLVIDKTTGKQKIIMTKAEPTIKEIKQIQKTPTFVQKTSSLVQKQPTLLQKAPNLMQKTTTLVQKAPTLIQTNPALLQTAPTLLQTAPTLLQAAPTLIQSTAQSTKKSSQAEQFIILPTQNAPRTGRTQKIVIDPQTGKAHMILSKGNEPAATLAENKPVSAKLVPSKPETNAPGNTVMIITNAQGAQSRIVLTPEHEKILFPNKQQQKGSQLKTIAHRITTTNTLPQLKTVLNPPAIKQIIASAKAPTRIVPKQNKNAIITSKGQLIVGGRVATTAQNIAPMPEIRQIPKRLSQTEPRKLVQAIQKTNSEPIIFLQQKSGAVMQLTASQFDQLQRSGQIVQKTPAQPVQERVIIQKSRTLVEASSSQKPRARKTAVHSPAPAKKSKHQHEIAIAPAPARHSPLLPALTPIISQSAPAPALPITPTQLVTYAPAPSISSAIPSSSFSEYDNFEEMLPSTAIARHTLLEPEPPAAPTPAEPTAAALTDGLLAVPGEHFGGPVGSFYLCVEEQGNYTPIDNRPLVLENNQLMPMSEVAVQPQPERRDILSAALANSDVFHADAGDAPDFRDLNANVSVNCRVSETSTTLHQPIMTPQEVPSSTASEVAPPATLEDGLAVIGVTPHSVPTSLELPITVTDPRIAPRTTDPLGGGGYGTTLMPSPGAELCYVSAEESVGPISMPLLTEEEDANAPGGIGGKSMPILTDDVGERTVSSIESALGSPASLGAEADDSSGPTWTRRLLTPGSDASDLSAEIPLQPAIQLSASDLSDHT